MTKFYIVRHGESLGNHQHLFLGHTDLGLTERGHAQAELTAEYLKDVHIDAFCSSDLTRAYETCKHIADKKGMDITIYKGLREIFAGEWEGKPFDLLMDTYPSFKVWLDDFSNARCNGGESVRELKERVEKTFDEIAKANPGKTLCVVTHATPIRIMCTLFRGLNLDCISDICWVPNASVTEVTYDQGKWTLLREGYKEHMGDISTELPSKV